MGSITYNFLSDSILLNDSALESKFHNESIDRLKKEIFDYRDFCIQNFESIISEIRNKESELKVFSSSEEISLELLSQTAFYIEQYIIVDPIFKLTDLPSEASNITSSYLGYEKSKLKKEDIYKAAKFLKDIQPMVVSDYIKIFPLSYFFEIKEVPLNFPLDNYNNILPRSILSFFYENSKIQSLIKAKTGWIVEQDKLYPCRGIIIDFIQENFSRSYLYHLFQTEVLNIDEKTNKVNFRYSLPDEPPTEEDFNVWVKQSLNSASRQFFDKVFNEIVISSKLQSTFLSNDQFTSQLITKNFDVKETISSFTATQVINLDLPFLKSLNFQELMDIRKYEAETFTSFRLELEKSFRELRMETDQEILSKKIENVFHELSEVQVQKINRTVDNLKIQKKINTTLGLAGLASSFYTSGFSLFGSAIALGKGYKNYYDYKTKVKGNPSYLLWKTLK